MIAARRLQRSFADGFIGEEVTDLWEPWMRHADEALNDDQLLEIIQQELSKRCKKSKTRGRPSTPGEIILRMLLLKHMRGWSYEDVTREVRANLVYREFTGVGGGKVPTTRPWAGWRVNWVPKQSSSYNGARWRSHWSGRSCRAAGCAWIQQ